MTQKKVTLVLNESEAAFVEKGAEVQELSINQFLKRIIFPDNFSDSLDGTVYNAIRKVTEISKAASIRLKLQKHIDVIFQKTYYAWFERYNYIFIFDKGVYYPMCQAPIGMSPYQAIYTSILNTFSVGTVLYDRDFVILARHLYYAQDEEDDNVFYIEGVRFIKEPDSLKYVIR